MKFLSTWLRNCFVTIAVRAHCLPSSMKFLSTWLRNAVANHQYALSAVHILNEVPEHMAQEYPR